MLKAPFPWFGGKRKVAPLVWRRFGAVRNYVEPFAGSLAVLLGAPDEQRIETVNDADGLLSNFWRAVSLDAESVAAAADWPVSECDLHARHQHLVTVRSELTDRLCGDPDYYDAELAGWWVWGLSCWIGSGWCSGVGPWQQVDGKLVNVGRPGVERKRPHLGDAGQGVNRQLPHLGDAGRGVKRQRNDLMAYMQTLQDRLRNVRVCCGDWTRVMGPSVVDHGGFSGIFLDPPYSNEAGRDMNLYAKDCGQVAHDVREWCIANGGNPKYRIALCGYEGEGHDELEASGWSVEAWNAGAGYGGQKKEQTGNGKRERIWFSPACIKDEIGGLFPC